jgi:hypothetical protein
MNNLQLTIKKGHLNHLKESTYRSKNRFILVYDPIKDNKVKAGEEVDSCREVICDELRTKLRRDEQFDVKKLRLILYTKFLPQVEWIDLEKKQKSYIELLKTEYNKEMLTSIKIINMLEKEFTWPLTKIYHVESKQLNENNDFYYFEGSKKWIKTPNIFSLFMLLTRIGSSLKKHTGFRTLDGFYKNLTRNESTLDISYLKTHFNRCLLALKHYNRLFGKTSMKDLYCPPDNDLIQFSEGINSLCNLDTLDINLRRKFTKIIDEEKMLNSWEKQ